MINVFRDFIKNEDGLHDTLYMVPIAIVACVLICIISAVRYYPIIFIATFVTMSLIFTVLFARFIASEKDEDRKIKRAKSVFCLNYFVFLIFVFLSILFPVFGDQEFIEKYNITSHALIIFVRCISSIFLSGYILFHIFCFITKKLIKIHTD